MKWKIQDDRPIWLQLKEQIIKKILSGQYKSGEKVPSVRELAKDAGVNPNTMQRALAALDQEGLIVKNRTTGRCITDDKTLIAVYRRNMAEEIIRDYINGMKELGYTETDAFELLHNR